MKRIFFLAIFSSLLFSCAHKTSRLVLWTDCVDFVSYAELFNASQDKTKVIVMYKDDLAGAMPPAKNDAGPDIIAGAFLRGVMRRNYFSRLDSLFGTHALSRERFYPSLLEAGQLKKKQYLLPVSFNLPALVFQTNNYDYAQSAFFSFDDIKHISTEFNTTDGNGVYSAMAFGPHWNSDFLYLAFKTAGVVYLIRNGELTYHEGTFQSAVDATNEWSEHINGGVQSELDFAFNFLYTPFYEQVKNGHSLFAYATSDQLFSLTEDQLKEIDFHWICNDGKIQVEDDMVMAGIYSASKNKAAARQFLLWLLNEDSQKKMLERKFAMNLRTQTFGIAGGFSSLQGVNQRFFSSHCRALLPNLLSSELICAPQMFPENWNNIKRNVVIPFIEECTQKSDMQSLSLQERYAQFVEQTMQSKPIER